MAKDFSKAFYGSVLWRKAREAKIASVFGLCERCGRKGDIVHHKIKLTPDNINNSKITLALDNLEYLCITCHNQEHNGGTACIDGYGFDIHGNFVRLADKQEHFAATDAKKQSPG